MKRSVTSIKTAHLFLRQIDETDAESIVSLRSEEEVYKFFFNPVKLTVFDHQFWYWNHYIHDTSRIDWVAVDDNSGAFIGVYGLKRIDVDIAEISYITKRDQQGNGYAKEAVEAVVSWCVDHWKISEFVAAIHKENKDSICFAEALGLERAGSEGCFIKMKMRRN